MKGAGLLDGLDGLFARAAAVSPLPGPAAERRVAACGTVFRLLLAPWRAARRAAAAPFGPDGSQRILAEEALWRGGGVVITPNRYPVSDRHLLIWEEEHRREPSAGLLELLARLTAARPDLLAFVNSVGAAATVARAHAQLLAAPETLAVDAMPLRWEEGPGAALGFPEPPWPAFGAVCRGGPRAAAAAADRLLRLRRVPAFNVAARRGDLVVYPRRREVPAPHYPLPLGALELTGSFVFEAEAAFAAMDGARVGRALAAACLPPGPAAAAAVRAALA